MSKPLAFSLSSSRRRSRRRLRRYRDQLPPPQRQPKEPSEPVPTDSRATLDGLSRVTVDASTLDLTAPTSDTPAS